jgi:hypothetical protein
MSWKSWLKLRLLVEFQFIKMNGFLHELPEVVDPLEVELVPDVVPELVDVVEELVVVTEALVCVLEAEVGEAVAPEIANSTPKLEVTGSIISMA